MMQQVCHTARTICDDQMSGMFGMPADQGGDLGGKLDQMRATIQEVNRQFQDPDKTTFVCVCIAEFLSRTIASFRISCKYTKRNA
jgi:anion-transporting  ArsA/GET3 family ATPase